MTHRRARRRSAMVVAALVTLALTSGCAGSNSAKPDVSDEPAVIPKALQLLRDTHAGLPGAPDDYLTLSGGQQEADINGQTWSAQLRDVHAFGALGGEEPGAVGVVDVKPGDGTTQTYLLATDKSGGVRRSAVFPLGLNVVIEKMAIVERQIGVTFSDDASTAEGKRKTHFRLVAYAMNPVEPPLILVSRSDFDYKPMAATTNKPGWSSLFTTGVKESGQVAYQQRIVHTFTATESQQVDFSIDSDDNDAYMTLTGPDGVVLADGAKYAQSWSGTLLAGEYVLSITTSNGAGTAYVLTGKS